MHVVYIRPKKDLRHLFSENDAGGAFYFYSFLTFVDILANKTNFPTMFRENDRFLMSGAVPNHESGCTRIQLNNHQP